MVPPSSHGIPRVPRYSGSPLLRFVFDYVALTLYGRPSHAVLLTNPSRDAGPYPGWPPPRSLATTSGISVDVFSSPYLDVSVQAVPHVYLFDSVYVTLRWVSPFGYLRISAHLQLPEAFRSLSRPSSAPDAKAFPLRSFSLDLFGQTFQSWSNFLVLLKFELCRLHYWISLLLFEFPYCCLLVIHRFRCTTIIASFLCSVFKIQVTHSSEL